MGEFFTMLGDVSYSSMHEIFQVERARCSSYCGTLHKVRRIFFWIRRLLLNGILRDTIERLIMLQ